MNKKKPLISVNFLMPSSIQQKTFNMLKFFVLAVFVLNMSLSGVFFVADDALACHGDITIKKVINGEESAQIFNFSGDLGDFSLAGGESRNFTHQPGHVIYTITEEQAEGWELESIECDSGDTEVNLASSTVSVNLQNLDDITCVFTNKENPPEPFCGDGKVDPGEECDDGNNIDNDGCSANCDREAKLIVKKIVVNGQATSSDWTINIDNGLSFPGSYAGVEKWLPVGIYNITESDYLSDYYSLGYSGDCDSSGNVELSISTAKICTLTNTYSPICGDGNLDPGEECDDGNQINDDSCNNNCEPRGELIVKKIVVGGEATSSDWTMNIANGPSFPGSSDGVSNWLDVGMYQVTETPNIPHYNLTYSGDCGQTGNVSVAYNETSICVLTNIYEPYCGDYNVDPGEECDDGPTGSETCTAECKLIPPECGDGKVDPGEECDDGNQINDDSCNNNCERQGELIVKKIVVNGTATSSDWTMLVGDTLSFPGSPEGVSNWVRVGGYQIGEIPDNAHYSLDFGGDCSEAGYISVEYGSSATCVLTNTYEPYCGDYNVDSGEECDDGPAGSATCSPECKTIEICDSSISGQKIDYFSEQGLAGWTIELNHDDGSFIASATTDNNGFYGFNNLCAGTYKIKEIKQAGWTQMSPLDPDYYSVSIYTKNSNIIGKDFVNRHEVGDLKICKYADEDGSLISQRDQSPVYDWPFTVAYPDQSTSTVRTDEGGCVILSDQPIGVYTVSENDTDGWVIISPESGTASTTVRAGETAELDFYNTRYGESGMICGYKYEDPDNNPATANTKGLKNWTIELSDTANCAAGQEWADGIASYEPGAKNNGDSLDSEDADASKALGEAEQDDSLNYVSLGFGGVLILEFDNIIMNGVGADIEIFETSPSAATLENNPEKARVYASQSGEDGSWVELGLAVLDSSLDLGPLSWAKYVKLVDESDSSQFGPMENGYDVDGVRAPYCRGDWRARSSVLTDDSGRYCFYGLAKGLYRVNEVLQPDWINTTPLYYDILFDYGNEEDYNFNNYYDHEEEHYCGDGILDAGEACDDGNNKNGDGCSATCNTEGGGGGRTYLKIVDVEARCIAEDAVVVNWRTNKSATSWVVYGTSSNDIADATTIKTASKTTTHSVTISGLVPGIDYYFNPYSESASDVDHATVKVNTDECCQVLGEEGEPVLTIQKTVGQDFVNPGEKGVQYTIIVKNTGNLTAFNVILTDLLPKELNYSDLDGKTRNWDLGDIEPGGSKMINYLVDVSADADSGFYKNIAEVKADNHPLIKDDADVESREIEVLAETGFSLSEFILLIMLLSVSFGSALYLKEKYFKA